MHSGVGEVTGSDLDLAAAGQGIVIGFNLMVPDAVKSMAKQKNVDLKIHSIIYDIIDDIRSVMEGKLSIKEDRETIGIAQIKAVFGNGKRKVAGKIKLN